MENMTSENAPVSYYSNDTGNGATAALLAGIATKDYYNPVDMVSAGGVCDLRAEVGNTKYIVKDAEANIRREVAKTESDLRLSIHDAECAILAKVGDAECNIIKEVMETRHTLAKDILRSEYESKLATQQAIKEITMNAQHNAERTQDKTEHGFEENTEAISALSAKIDQRFFHMREEGLEEKVDSLRDKLQTQTLKELICCGCGNSAPGNSGK